MSLHGDVALVGASGAGYSLAGGGGGGESGEGGASSVVPGAGAAFVFRRGGKAANSWRQEAELVGDEAVSAGEGAAFGASVHMD